MLPGTRDAYLDIAKTYLLIRAKVVRGVGTDIAADTPMARVNNWLHSLFSHVDAYLNDTFVTPSVNTYPFRAYVDTVLSYGAEANNIQLTSQLWYNDTKVDGGNGGLVERWSHISESRVVEMMGRLHVDLFLKDIFILNGPSVKIRLVRTNDAFSLIAGGKKPDYKVQIVDDVLFARKAVLSPNVQMAHIKDFGKRDNNVSYTTRGLQGLLHSTRYNVAHAREPVPRDATETTNIVMHRQRRLQRRIH